MEGKIVCKVNDEYVKLMLISIGIGDGNGDIVIVDKDSDRSCEMNKIYIPLYDANQYVKKRLIEYDSKVH